MPIYIALLRGINIGPHKRMKMEKLRASCEALGFGQVQTLIQSGNVVFQTAKLSPEALSRKIEQQVVCDFGFSAAVITRTKDELRKIMDKNPLVAEHGIETAKLHVVFLPKSPEPAAIRKLESLTLAPDKVHHAGKETYFYFPKGVSGSSLWKHPLDRVMGVAGTMRNWNTVTKLYQMAAKCG